MDPAALCCARSQECFHQMVAARLLMRLQTVPWPESNCESEASEFRWDSGAKTEAARGYVRGEGAGALLLKGRDEVSVGRCREVAQAELARYIESLWG